MLNAPLSSILHPPPHVRSPRATLWPVESLSLPSQIISLNISVSSLYPDQIMARFLSQTLLRHATTTTISTSRRRIFLAPPIASTSIVFFHHRHFSNHSGKGQLIELELESSSDGDVEVAGTGSNSGIRKLEELIHRIIVIRSQPAWLPFVPGTSYWVPPIKKPGNFAELLGRIANPLTEDEAMSLTTVRGWPSSDYFIEGDEFRATEVDVGASGPLQVNSRNKSKSEDDEG